MRDFLIELKNITMCFKDIRLFILTLCFFKIAKFLWKIYVILFIYFFIKNTILVRMSKKKKFNHTYAFFNYIDMQAYVVAIVAQKTTWRLKLKMFKRATPRILFVFIFRINLNFIKLYIAFLKLLIQKFEYQLAPKSYTTWVKKFPKLLQLTFSHLIEDETNKFIFKFNSVLNK